jgi:hypothetical protein
MNKAGISGSKNTLYCSFCGKRQHEVRKLIAGPINRIRLLLARYSASSFVTHSLRKPRWAEDFSPAHVQLSGRAIGTPVALFNHADSQTSSIVGQRD